MKLTFLCAADGTPLTKRFVQTPHGVDKHQYPHVRDFTSFEREAESLEDALVYLQGHAEAGHCLLKGHLDRPIESESRAGHTNSFAETDWIFLDFDFEDGFQHVDDILSQLGVGGVDYILHHSASSGITSKPGLRAHVLMQLDRPQSPSLIKEWLKAKNLSIPALRKQLPLTASKMAVLWALDVTTCQNDKLLFLADPMVEGIEDPMVGKRFQWCPRGNATVTLDMSGVDPERIRQDTDNLIAELRENAGLPKRTARYRLAGNGERLLLNPARAIVTGERVARGFVKLNLNGQTDWGYFYPESNPEILYNFMGEPPSRLADIVPEYYALIKPRDPIDPVEADTERFICRSNAQDLYYTCIYRPDENFVELSRAARGNLADFMGNHGAKMPAHVPEWDIVFDPTSLVAYDPQRRWINTFRVTPYMTDPAMPGADVPPVIRKVLWSLCGNLQVFNHFLNWLAYFFQTRNKPKTSFLFSGVEGTGKGVFFERILAPLFGPTQCQMHTIDAIRDDFNEWMANCLILALDEFKVENKDSLKVPEKLRNLITEESIGVRGMRANRRTVPSHMAVLIFTNLADPMKIPASDRRYTIAPRQSAKLPMTDPELEQIAHELPEFASFLLNYDVDAQAARTALDTEDKQLMRQAAEGTGERIIRAIAEGDLQFFVNLMDSAEMAAGNASSSRYNRVVRDWYAGAGKPAELALDDVRAVHNHITAATTSKVRLIRQLHESPLNIQFSGLSAPTVTFQIPEHAPPELNTRAGGTNVTPLKRNSS